MNPSQYPFSLSGSEKKKLRGMAQLLEAKVHAGKDAVAADVVRQLEFAFKHETLVKVRFHTPDRKVVMELCSEIAEIAGALCVSQVGRTATFFRPPPATDSGNKGIFAETSFTRRHKANPRQ